MFIVSKALVCDIQQCENAHLGNSFRRVSWSVRLYLVTWLINGLKLDHSRRSSVHRCLSERQIRPQRIFSLAAEQRVVFGISKIVSLQCCSFPFSFRVDMYICSIHKRLTDTNVTLIQKSCACPYVFSTLPSGHFTTSPSHQFISMFKT